MKKGRMRMVVVLFIGIALILSVSSMAGETGKIDLNKATVEELVKINGIGQAYAERIVEYREQNGPYKSLEDLLAIKGIGEKKLESIRDMLIIGEISE